MRVSSDVGAKRILQPAPYVTRIEAKSDLEFMIVKPVEHRSLAGSRFVQLPSQVRWSLIN